MNRIIKWLPFFFGAVAGFSACRGVTAPAAPDPLQATAAAVGAAGSVITREVRAVEAELLADMRARRRTCPAGPDRNTCLALAREQALAAIAPRIARLTEAASLQNAAAAALEEVDRCRRAGGACADHEAAALAVASELAPLLPALTGGHP